MKINYTGFSVQWSSEGELKIDGQKSMPDVRTVGQMRPVLLSHVELDDSAPTYYMYRNTAKKRERPLFEKHGLRFDITIVPSLWLGKEYNKTFGHYHPSSPSGIPYMELYEVIRGEAHYLLQKRKEKSKELEKVLLVKTREGQKAIMPPGFGHVTINTGGLLMMDNIVAEFKSDYAPYTQHHGAAYYWTKEGLEKNPYYDKVPAMEEISATELNHRVNEELAQRLEKGNSYSLYLKYPEWFSFLKNPALI